MKKYLIALLLLLPSLATAAPSNNYFVATFADLKVITAGTAPSYGSIYVTQYYSGVSSPGATYRWDAASTDTDDACTVVNPTGNSGAGRWLLNWSQKIDIRLCGYQGNGSTNDYDVLKKVLAAVAPAQGEADIPGGPFPMPSASVFMSPISVPNGVTIQCARDGTTAFTLTGTTVAANWFTANNPSNVWFKNCTFIGNGAVDPTDASNAGAILFHGQPGAGPMENFGCASCKFQNFSQPYWVHVLNESSNSMSHIRFSDIQAVSVNGNNPHPSVIGYEANAISFWGEVNDSAGKIKDIVVDGLNCDATYIKMCVSFFDGVVNAHVDHAVATRCGSQSQNDNTTTPGVNLGSGSYCFLAYRHNNDMDQPSDIHITNTTCETPNSACFYTATAKNVFVDNMRCSGQFDIQNAQLPKGCVALNQPQNAAISNVICLSSFICVESQNDGSSTVQLTNITARSSVENAVGIWVAPLSYVDATSQTIIQNPSIALTGSGSVCLFINSNNLPPPPPPPPPPAPQSKNPGYVQLNGGRMGCSAYDIQSYDTTDKSGACMTGFDASNVIFEGAVQYFAVYFPSIGGCSLNTPISFRNITVDATNFVAAARGLYLDGVPNLSIDGLLLENKNNTGVMISATGTRGAMTGVQFRNVASGSRVSSSDFGTAVPGWAADRGTFIQNLNPTTSHLHGYTNLSGGISWADD